MSKELSRRNFIKLVGAAAATAITSACTPQEIRRGAQWAEANAEEISDLSLSLKDAIKAPEAPEAPEFTPPTTTITLYEHDNDGRPGGRRITYGPEDVQRAIDKGRVVTHAIIDIDVAGFRDVGPSFVTWEGASGAEVAGWTDAQDPEGLRWHLPPAQLLMSRWGYQSDGVDNTDHTFAIGLGDGSHQLNLEKVSPMIGCEPDGEPFNDRVRGVAMMVNPDGTPASTTITLYEHDEDGHPGGKSITLGPEDVQRAIDKGRVVTHAIIDIDATGFKDVGPSFVEWSAPSGAEVAGWTDAQDPEGLRWHLPPAQLLMSRWGYQSDGVDNTDHTFAIGLGDGSHQLNLEKVSPMIGCEPDGEPFNDRVRGVAMMVQRQ